MPEPRDADRFLRAHQAYCPTELGGMMGYLTAVEQYLAELEGIRFDVGTIMRAAQELEEPAFQATTHMIEQGFALAFEAAVEAITA
jgi:hypothetical protein